MARPTLITEEVLISSWWKNRVGDALRLRLIHYGTAGITCDIKHLEEFSRAFRAATRKAEALGLLSQPHKGQQ
jgi:hypothetical protein